MQLREDLIDESRYGLKCPYYMDAQMLIVHNTANDAPAQNEINYMQNNNSSTSFHIAVDDEEAILGIPLDRNTWNCGDGTNGYGNRNGISIEICYSTCDDERWDKARANAIELIAEMLIERGWGIDKVTKHQDYNGKYCPHRILDEGWDEFISEIEDKMNEMQSPLRYKAHIQDIGWSNWVNAGEVAGTTGQCLRMEAIIIESPSINLEYRAHVAEKGWLDWVHNGEVAGTTGESRRMEALEINSSVSLRVSEHVEKVGWLPVSEGQHIKVGTEGKSLRLEAIKIELA